MVTPRVLRRDLVVPPSTSAAQERIAQWVQESGGAPAVMEASPAVAAAVPVAAVAPAAPAVVPPPVAAEVVAAPAPAAPADPAPAGSHKVRLVLKVVVQQLLIPSIAQGSSDQKPPWTPKPCIPVLMGLPSVFSGIDTFLYSSKGAKKS